MGRSGRERNSCPSFLLRLQFATSSCPKLRSLPIDVKQAMSTVLTEGESASARNMVEPVALRESSVQQDAGRFHIPSLDGLRAVAILLVFLSHAGLGHVVPGGFGVTIFFFLSGYLITTLLRREFQRNGNINLRHFYLRRILRIWPAFYLVLLLGVVLTIAHVIPGQAKLVPTLAQLFHFANYYSIFASSGGMTAGTGVFWSLAVEEHFYLLFPFVYGLLLTSRLSAKQQFSILVAGCVAVLVWRVYLVMGLGAPMERTYYASDTRLDSLLFGCTLAIYVNPMFDGKTHHQLYVKYGVVPIALLAILCTFLFRSETFRETFRYTIQGIALFPIFIAAISFPNWSVFRVLNTKLAKFLGDISYSFYLVHFTVIETVKFHAGEISKSVQGVISFAISIVIAWTIYKVIDHPIAKVRQRLTRS